MANEKIVDYIKKSLKAGFSKERIWIALEKAGWKKAQIDEAFGLAKKEKPTPKKFLPILLIVVAIAGFAALGFFYWQMRVELLKETQEVEDLLKQIDVLEKQIEELKTKEEIPTDETATWKTYRNEELKFEFKYPSEWTLIDMSREEKESSYLFNAIIETEGHPIYRAGHIFVFDTPMTMSFVKKDLEQLPLENRPQIKNIENFSSGDLEGKKFQSIYSGPSQQIDYDYFLNLDDSSIFVSFTSMDVVNEIITPALLKDIEKFMQTFSRLP